jgi:hypothetical protein
MNQIPGVPMMTNPYMVQQQTTYMPVPQLQPKLNAVNIEINNPTVGGTAQPQTAQPQYAQPTMPYYTYPQAQVYNYPQAQVAQPTYYPPIAPQVVMPPKVETVYPQQPQVAVAQPQPVAVEQPQVAVAQPQPVAVEQPQVAVVPQPQVQQVPTQTIQQQNINAPVVPQPVVTAPEAQPVAEKPEIVPAETVAPQVDLNSFIAKLSNPDFEVQSEAMEQIANLVKESPEKATELVDTKVFDALTNIINFDSSNLEGPTAEQLAAREKIMTGKDVTDAEKELANKIAPKEQAERNKSYALFTSAIMQKLYGDEVQRLSNTTVPLTELPGAITIVDNLKDNPNPMVRASAIEALSYIQNPAYKNDLQTVFKIAQNDQDPGVAETAKAALDRLNQV